MEHTRAISYITVMPDTKSGIELFVSKVLAEVEIRDALPLLVKLTAMGEIIERVKDGLKDQILSEASLFPEKSFVIDGARFTKVERKTYHYKHCQKWQQLKADLDALQEMMKVGKEFADPETGELIPPANVSYTESVSVTLKK